MLELARCHFANEEWGNSFLAERTARGVVKIGIVATVTVGYMAALSRLTHRDMGNVYDVGNIIDPVNAAFTLRCKADVVAAFLSVRCNR